MHFVLTYDITTTGPTRQSIEDDIHNIIRPYKWIKVLTTFYIIKINSKNDWQTILNSLGNTAKTKVYLRFVMSPPMVGGTYNGMLKNDEWNVINEITKEV